nr:reverse transcriptase domain-containing protein [Tanacetum cinerariifolium]
MSTNEQTPLSQPTSGREEQAPRNLVGPISDEDLREYCDKNYHQILPIIAEKLHQEKAQQEKLKAVKARLNFEEASRLGDKEKNVSAHSRGSERKSYYNSRKDTESCYQSSRSKETKIASEKHRHKREYSRRTEAVSESEGSAGGHWKSKPKKQKSSVEDDLSQPWVCEKTDPFTPRIRYFDFPKARMPSHIKTYDESEDPKDHLKIFEFVRRYKLECRDVKGALECMKISGFMHGITNLELIKRLQDKIPKSMDKMMSVTTTFLRGEVAASNWERKKSFPSWKQEAGQKQNFKRGNFRNEQMTKRKQDKFTLHQKKF